MLDSNALMELQERSGGNSREMDVFCYMANYPYLNA